MYIRQNALRRNGIEDVTHVEAGWVVTLGLSLGKLAGDCCPLPPCCGVVFLSDAVAFFFGGAGGLLWVGVVFLLCLSSAELITSKLCPHDVPRLE